MLAPPRSTYADPYIYIYIIPAFLNISAKKRVKANSLQHYLFIFTCTLHPFGRGISQQRKGFRTWSTSILSRRSPINNECSIVGQGGSRNIKLWISRRGGGGTEWCVLVVPWESQGIPAFLRVISHMLRVQNLHFSWFWGPRVVGNSLGLLTNEASPQSDQSSGRMAAEIWVYRDVSLMQSSHPRGYKVWQANNLTNNH